MSQFIGNISVADEGLYNSPYYIAMVWFGIPLYLNIVQKGYTIMKSDADISYTSKDIWKAYESMVNRTGADLIFMKEEPVNTGQFYAIPNERVMAFFAEWIVSKNFFKTSPNQPPLTYLNNKTYMICNSTSSCGSVKTLSMNREFSNRLRIESNNDIKMAAVATYASSFLQYGSVCPPTVVMNPCDQRTLYVHPICTVSSQDKISRLKQLGFWLLEDACKELTINITLESLKIVGVTLIRCVPTPRLSPTVDDSFLNCGSSDYIAF